MQGSTTPRENLVQIKGVAVDTNSGNKSAGTQRVVLADDQPTVPVSLSTSPLPSGAATESTLATRLSESDFDAKTGSLTETAPSTDTASSGLNGRLQRIAQRLTSLITAVGTPFQAGGSIGNTTFASTQSGTWNINNVSGTVSLPTGAATSANQSSELTLIGAVNETAPASDTASSGLNGRLQRIAQRITSLIALIPTALTGSGNFKVAILEAIAAGTNYIGKTRLTDGTTDAEVVPLTGYNAQAVAIVDGSGNQITSFGGSSSTTATPFSASYTTAQTNIPYLTPTSGKSLYITSAHATIDYATQSKVTVRLGLGTPTPTTAAILKHEGMVSGSIYNAVLTAPVKGAVNQSLYVTTTAATGGSVDIVITYYEV